LIYALKKFLSDFKDNWYLFYNPNLNGWGFFILKLF